MSSPVEGEAAARGTGRDNLPRVVVAALVVLIVAGLVLAVVLVLRDRSTGPKQPAGQRSVSTTDQTPGVSATATPGQPVIAVGHAPAPGAAPAMIPGIVLALDQRVPATDPDSESKLLRGVIQIYAAVQPEDNGGPVVNSAGQVIGVVVAEAAALQTQSAVPVAYAIPIRMAMRSAETIREGNGQG